MVQVVAPINFSGLDSFKNMVQVYFALVVFYDTGSDVSKYHHATRKSLFLNLLFQVPLFISLVSVKIYVFTVY